MILLVGESGSGKTCTEQELERRGFKRVISYTTRPKRDNEVNGVHYKFVSRDIFESLIAAGYFAEYVPYLGNLYGTAKEDCVDDRVIVVEPEGLKQLQENIDLKTFSFYLQASESVRLNRMVVGRGDSAEYALNRIEHDKKVFEGISGEVDFVINANMPVDWVVEEILKRVI